ncbi:MAG: Nramp family divalent metal transporter [Acidobacteria bacterium]|nr:Nramp family divalent metal transporter [Acidobacteriota bacterium]
MQRLEARSGFWSAFGPGLLWAAAAIGISHLVQSTRAGAMAGFGLVGVVLLANILKYPFFEFGPRYAAATGESLIDGYRRIGRWALWLYIAITIATGLIVQSAIVLLTSFLLGYAFGVELPLAAMGAIVCIGSGALLFAGRYRLLDILIKGILLLLAVSTIVAAVVSLGRADLSTLRLLPSFSGPGSVSFPFVLALVGWMPSAIDIAVWSSLWTLANDESAGSTASMKHALLDFRIGYIGTVVMAFAFLTLGATVMHGSGQMFSPQGTRFSAQLIELYGRVLGDWTIPIVATAVLTTMLSTAVTVIDGYPRAIDRSIRVLSSGRYEGSRKGSMGPLYWVSLLAMTLGTVAVLGLFAGTLAAMRREPASRHLFPGATRLKQPARARRTPRVQRARGRA